MKLVFCVAALAALLAGTGAGSAQAQAPVPFRSRATDSLRADLRRTDLADTQRVLTLFSLEQAYHMNDDATALRVARQALALARQQGFVRGEMMVLSDLARIAGSLHDLPQAERWAQTLQRRAAAAPASLQRFRLVALQTLANVAVAQDDPPRALAYLRRALPLLPLVANRPGSDLPLITYYGLSSVCIGQVQALPQPPDSLVRQAHAYSTRFAALARTLGRPDMLANAYSNLGHLSGLAAGDSAAYYFGRAVGLYQQLNMRFMESAAHKLWATSEYRHGRPAAAIAQARQAVALARAVQAPDLEYEARDVLAEALNATGAPAEAYQQARRARQLHDSTEKVVNRTELQRLQVKFDTDQKEAQIQVLTRQQTLEQQRLTALALGLGAALLALAVAAALALRLRRSRALLAAQHAELSETRAAQDRLYALVAHDLRSPVVAFTGLADLLHRYVRLQDTARLASLGGLIRQAAQNLSELLDNLLNWAISQRGELVPAPRPLRVAELLAETVALYQATADAADIALTVTAPADLLVQADPNMTRTILRNLTGNALKATPAGGTVMLHATPTASGISLQVTDTGPGLPPALLTQMATPTAHLRVARHGHGTGLGLLLSRTFAEAQGGSLALGNATAGPGAVATLTLPQG